MNDAPTQYCVVGVGASAGGLEALSALLDGADLGAIALVVLQHRERDDTTMLPELLARHTSAVVVHVTDHTRLSPNHVFVVPTHADVSLAEGMLLITKASDDTPRRPIDRFFRALAAAQGPASVGVILSGTGSDGTLGLRAIKEAGGVTFAQSPESARFDSMPRAAVAAGAVDFCLPPPAIAQELCLLSQRVAQEVGDGDSATDEPRAGPPDEARHLTRLLELIKLRFHNDLNAYKPSTVRRRLHRRMTLLKIGELADYAEYAGAHPDELRALYKDMLVSVTSFFRDPTAFDALKRVVFPQMMAKKGDAASVRIWVPGCATGEEAYSIAMCLHEFLGDDIARTKIQIFATDADADCVARARRGAFPMNIDLDVSAERLARFFVASSGEYQISRRVRDNIIFSQQNVLRDAPLSRLDLVSCRNLLIYLQPPAQKRVLRIIHHALLPSGFLMLGASEAVGDQTEGYALVDRAAKIYERRFMASFAPIELGLGAPSPPTPARGVGGAGNALRNAVDRRLLERFAPPGVVVSESLNVLEFRGRTAEILDPTPGAATFDLMRLARPELRPELRRVVQLAFAERRAASAEVPIADQSGAARVVRIEALPVEETTTETHCVAVVFEFSEPAAPPMAPTPDGAPTTADAQRMAARIEELERENRLVREHLQSTLEEKLRATEELKAANEELQSSNEELQSTNEELETTKEEVLSTNEELTTVNEELQNRMSELSQTNDDLHNVLAGVDNAVMIVGLDLRLRRFTAAAERILNLVPEDVGRSIASLRGFLAGLDVASKTAAVVHSLATTEEEVLAENERWYALKIAPYKTLDHSIRGAVLTLTDIDVKKRAADLLRDVREYATRFLGGISHPLLIVDAQLRVVWTNETFLTELQLTEEETIGSLLPHCCGAAWSAPTVRGMIEATLSSGRPFKNQRLELQAADGSTRIVHVGGSSVPSATQAPLVLLSMERP